MLLLAALTLHLATNDARSSEFSLTPVTSEELDDSYPAAIESLHAGPWRFYSETEADGPMNAPRAERWRMLRLSRQEESEDYLLIERVVMGDEGCCIRVQDRMRLRLFGTGEFGFVAWQGVDRFIFRYASEQYIIAGLGSAKIEMLPYRN